MKTISTILIIILTISTFYVGVYTSGQTEVATLITPEEEVKLIETARKLKYEKIKKQNNLSPEITLNNLINLDGEPIPQDLLSITSFKQGWAQIFILLEDPPVVEWKTNFITSDTSEEEKYLSFLLEKQQGFLHNLYEAGITYRVIFNFQQVLNGFYLEIPQKDISKIRAIPIFKEVQFPILYFLDDKYALELVKGTQVWSEFKVKGEGQVIAIVDTGIDYLHPDLGGGFGEGFKVIGGYDFGDMDSDPMDLQGHGTHVAGIAAAKASSAEGVNGLAPEAKLMAYKIVSGAGGIAASGAISAAFEHMVKFRGAKGEKVTVANLSFGAPGGFYEERGANEIAMNNAVTAGIFVVGSAGNQGASVTPEFFSEGSPTGKGLIYPSDLGMVSSPNTASLVTMVSSSNNSHQEIKTSFKVIPTGSTQELIRIPYLLGADSEDPVKVLTGMNLEYVNVGFGNHPNYYLDKDVKGKIALILRGGKSGEDATFVNKIHQAESHGAVLALVYNDEARGDDLIIMRGDPDLTIPRAFIGYNSGLWLINNPNNRIVFDGLSTTLVIPLSGADQISDFSSFGLTPEMGPKPEVTAPGGTILSTYPRELGNYRYNSGTSMASPFVAGASALIKQYLPNFNHQQVKTLLVNTADVLIYPGSNLPFSPRLQGGGRINLQKALRAPVIICGVNGESMLSLGDTDKRTSISNSLKLFNFSQTTVNYNLSSNIQRIQKNLSPTIYQGIETIFRKDNSILTNISINPGQELLLEVTFTISNVEVDYAFAEGYLTFTPTSGSEIPLNLPFIFFVGDFQDTSYKNPENNIKGFASNMVIDPPMDEYWSWFERTWLYSWSPDGEWLYTLGYDYTLKNIDRNYLAISPNGDGEQEDLSPILSLMRGTKELTFKVKGDNLITPLTLFNEYWVRKNSLDDEFRLWWSQLWFWGGGGLPEGNYSIEMIARVPSDPSPGDVVANQTVSLPIKIDITPPEIVVTRVSQNNQNVSVNWYSQDPISPGRSGLWGHLLILMLKDSEAIFSDFISPNATNYTFSNIPINAEFEVRVVVWDHAGNIQFGRLANNINPLLISPTKGGIGTIVTVSGSGFNPATQGVVWFDSNMNAKRDADEPFSQLTTTSDGTIPQGITLRVPEIQPGRYFIEADIPIGGSIESSAMFTVLISGLTVTPSSGVSGTIVTISGLGFERSSSGIIWFDTNTNGEVDNAEVSVSVTTQADGSLPSGVTLKIPEVPRDTYPIRADIPVGGTIEASAPFWVLGGIITLNPNRGKSGTTVEISGSGFSGLASGQIWFDANKNNLLDLDESAISVTSTAEGSLPSGLSLIVPAVENGIYPIRADLPQGAPIEVSVNFMVGNPPVINVSVSPAIINIGQSATISWQVKEANSLEVKPEIITPPVPLTGSATVSPTTTTTYLFTATGEGGITESRVTLMVIQPLPTITVYVSPTSIVRGESATLNWSVTNATSLTVNPSLGVSPLPLLGFATVSPTTTTTYVFTAIGPGGSAEGRVTLTVTEPALPPPPQFLRKWGSKGTENGQFNWPFGIAVDTSGNLYVADTGNHRIQKFNSSGTFITKWGSKGTENGQFNAPFGIALDTSGNLYVADYNNYRIQKFNSSGIFITKWGSKGTENGQFFYPSGVAVDTSGNVYVVDAGNHRIQKFNSSGTFITKWGSLGSGNGEFYAPTGIAIDTSGNLYVADYNNHRIQKFNSSGTFITSWGSPGSGNGQLDSPRGIAVDPSGILYVADSLNHRIQKFNSSGTFITKWGSYGTGDGQFNFPGGIVVDISGNLYVVDYGNHRIQVFSTFPTHRTVELRIGSTVYKVDGVVSTMDAAPYIEEGRTMVPVRFLAEGLGGTVGWDNTTRTVTVRFTKPVLEIKLIIGNPTATVNGNKVQIDTTNIKVVPVIKNNRTFVPLRFLVEQITGSSIDWVPPDTIIIKLPR